MLLELGLGREHALELARQGAMVVVNDFGTTLGAVKEIMYADAVKALELPHRPAGALAGSR